MSDPTHAISAWPEHSSKQSSLRSEQFPMNSHCTLSFQVSNRHCDAVLRWNAQQHVKMVGHRMPFQQFNPLLTAQLPQNLADLFPAASKQPPLPVLWNDHHVVLALPLHMGLTTPIFHLRSAPAPRGLPGRGSFHIHAGNGRALSILTSRAGGLTLI